MSVARTLNLSRALYAGNAVDSALVQFAAHATFEREATESHWVVTVTPKAARADARFVRRLCGELGNFALGLTIRDGGVGVDSAGEQA